MIPSWARVGAKVVVIDARATRMSDGSWRADLVEGGIHTLTSVRLLAGMFVDGPGVSPCATLLGVDSPRSGGWDLRRFRPLQTITQSDDMEAHFNELLSVKAPVLEGVV